MFQRGCGLDAGNPRIYILSDHRHASWGGGSIMLGHFPVFLFLPLCWWLLDWGTNVRALGTLGSPTWMGGWPGAAFSAAGNSRSNKWRVFLHSRSLLTLPPVVSSALTRGHSCPCVLSPCLISAWVLMDSPGEVLTLCSCNGAERLACERNWSFFFFVSLWQFCGECCGCRLRCHRVGEV